MTSRDTSADPTALCIHCGEGIYMNKGLKEYLHSQTGNKLCQWVATPDRIEEKKYEDAMSDFAAHTTPGGTWITEDDR